MTKLLSALLLSVMLSYFYKPTLERHLASPNLFFAPFYALLLLCHLPASHQRLRALSAVCLVPLWLVWPFHFRLHADPQTEDPTGGATHFGFLYFCMAFVTLDRLVWTELESFRRVTGESKDGKEVLEPVPGPFTWKRLKWALSLMLSFRQSVQCVAFVSLPQESSRCMSHIAGGVGWNFQVKHTPPAPATRPNRTRAGLILETVFMLLARTFVAEVVDTLFVLYLGQPLATVSIKTLPWHQQLGVTALSIFRMVCNSPFIADLVALPSLLFSDKPVLLDQYRPFWNDISSIRSLASAWGVAWHQGLRRITTRPAYLLLQHKLGVPPRTFTHAAVTVVVGFAVSGLGHMWTILVAGRTSGVRTLTFFMLQALGVLFEAALSAVSPWSCPLWLKRVWAVAFVAYTAPLFIEDS